MPNIKSAIKRVRTSELAAARNQAKRSLFRTRVKQAETDVSKTEQLPELIRQATSAIDKASRAGAIHPRQAARRKSRLIKKLQASAGKAIDLSTGKVKASAARPKAASKKADAKPASKKAATKTTSKKTAPKSKS
jgi:small subunit ribosomal protein S20